MGQKYYNMSFVDLYRIYFNFFIFYFMFKFVKQFPSKYETDRLLILDIL